jgi:hypothetical protein
MRRIRMFVLALLAASALASGAARAASDYTDIWWNPAESGWGANLVQNGDTIFATWFIYDANGAPTWYVAALKRDANDNFIGDVAEAKGTFFGAPWVPGNASGKIVGSATFAPSTLNAWQGTLAWTITNVGATTKAIERQTLAPITLLGTYAGAESIVYSGCSNSGNNGTFADYYTLLVSQSAANGLTLKFTFNSKLVCTLAGTLEQHGQQFNIANASYVCSDGLNTRATLTDMRRTAAGIEGKLVAQNVGGNCKETTSFAAAL